MFRTPYKHIPDSDQSKGTYVAQYENYSDYVDELLALLDIRNKTNIADIERLSDERRIAVSEKQRRISAITTLHGNIKDAYRKKQILLGASS